MQYFGNTIMNKFKVIIAGGRDFNDYQLLELNCNHYLKNKFPNIEIVSGKARGADYLGERYAENYLLDVKEFPADWSIGKSAGYIRNKQMQEYADALIAFWDGISKGTFNMIELMKEAEKPYRVVRY